MRTKLLLLGTIFPVILALDLITKSWALNVLPTLERPVVLGDMIPLTLAFNKGAAFGISVG